MQSPTLPLFTSIITTNPNSKTFGFNTVNPRKSYGNSVSCKASNSSSIMDFDLYDILGIDSSSDQPQIKSAYRKLQKRCHPDIAGPAGHDMAIILNEAYAILSDPITRFGYDKEQAKISEFGGYAGKPMYSVWFGSESEERAVFVDEVKCVGCLKCALFAENTFAIESVYGRARVVAQWADPKHKIQEAIEACPVDCISIVERSNLAALEFLMSKQPRGNVRIGAGNTAGTRVSNIFADVEKFQGRFREAMDKASGKDSREADYQREARITAIQAIRAISNWLYWQSPTAATSQIHQKLIPITQKTTEPDNIKRLREAAAARKQARWTTKPIHGVLSKNKHNDEYWTPTLVIPEPTKNTAAASEPSPPTTQLKAEPKEPYNEEIKVQKSSWSNPFVRAVPTGMATLAAAIVRLQIGEERMGGGPEEHIGGSLALDIVNSSWLQVILAGLTWYLIGMAIVELIQVIRSKIRMYHK